MNFDNKWFPIIYGLVSGASLELFMNFFTFRGANIYKSIKENMSTSEAQRIFEFEKKLVEVFENKD